MAPQRYLRGTLLASLIAISGFAPGGVRADTPQDTTTTAGTGDPTRGTVQPLERDASALQYTGRALLLVPYGVTRVITLPMEWITYVNERYSITEHVFGVLFGQYGTGKTVVGTFFGYESGLGLGLSGLTTRTTDFLATGALLEAKGGYFSPEKNRISVKYRTAPGRVRFYFAGRFDNREDRPFYGIGPETNDDAAYANKRRAVAEANFVFRLPKNFSTTMTGFVHDTDLSSPSTGKAIADSFPALYDVAEKSRYAGAELALAYDRRNSGPFSSRGEYLRIAGGIDRAGSSGDEDYEHYSAEAQTFVNLYHDTRILALRAFAEGMEADDPDHVPFTEREHLGGKYGLRGFSRDRFADQKMLQLTAEYRYRLTEHVFGNLFGDWGAVANEWEDLHPRDLESAYGFGVLFGSTGERYAITVAGSNEGAAVYLGIEKVFTGRSRRLR